MSINNREVAYGSDAYKALLALRYEILRKPLGLEITDHDVAMDDKEFHLAAYDNETPIGCVLLRPISKDVIKLRQMAVSDAYQGQGIGATLVRFAEDLARSRGYSMMEMHARTFAQGFYEKLGYAAEGDVFIEATVPNIKMRKSLQAMQATIPDSN